MLNLTSISVLTSNSLKVGDLNFELEELFDSSRLAKKWQAEGRTILQPIQRFTLIIEKIACKNYILSMRSVTKEALIGGLYYRVIEKLLVI